MKSRTQYLPFAALIGVVLCCAPATGRAARYLGPHPIAAQIGDGYCYIDVPHTHSYAPDRPALYQQVGQEYLFIGDPVPFGYDGERTVFYGPHPVPIRVPMPFAPPTVYCPIRGPHYHDYPAPPVPEYQVKDHAVFYVGPLEPAYLKVQQQVERAAEAEYRPFATLRPHFSGTPPPQWHGVVWTPPPAPAPPAVAQQPANPPRPAQVQREVPSRHRPKAHHAR